MKIYAIRDDEERPYEEFGYLFYYETDKKFYIELLSDSDPGRMPFILRDKAEEKCYTLDSSWSRIWVQQRIIPAERQNLGSILKEYHLSEYDEYQMLLLANGRCEQDHCYLSPVSEQDLPEEILSRRQRNLSYSIPIGPSEDLVSLCDGTLLRVRLDEIVRCKTTEAMYKRLLAYYHRLHLAIQQGGYEAEAADNVTFTAEEIRSHGENIRISDEELRRAMAESLINTAESAGILGCSRQYIQQCVTRGVIIPVRSFPKDAVFRKQDILAMKK